MLLRLLSSVIALTIWFTAPAHAQIPVQIEGSGNPEWLAACGQQGGYQACELLADQHLKGNGVPASPHMTAYYLLQACKYGNWEMCVFAYGMAETQPQSIYIQGEAAMLQCQNANTAYCRGIRALFSDETKAHYEPRFVGAALSAGCNRGDVQVCALMGQWFDDYQTPAGFAANLNLALTGYASACNASSEEDGVDGDFLSSNCHFAYKYGVQIGATAEARAAAEQALVRSCETGRFASCELAMSSFHHGVNGVSQNEALAARMGSLSCVRGRDDYCELSAYLLEQQEEYGVALQIWGDLCETSPGVRPCLGAARASYFSQGRENAQTTQFAQKACEFDDGWACYIYAQNTFYLGSNGNRSLFEKSCRLGFEQGCAEVTRQREQAARNEEIRRYNESNLAAQQQEAYATQAPPTWDDYMAAGHAYWTNWKPSYCQWYTSGGVTSKAECAN